MSGSTKKYVDAKLKTRRVMVFGKSNDPDSKQVKQILESYYLPRGKWTGKESADGHALPLLKMRTNGSISKQDKM